nr:peroxiredoxin family protein [Atopomonas sediminilitoris]
MYISAYLSVLPLALLFSGWQWSLSGGLAWLGAALTCASGLVFFLRLFLQPTARTSALLPGYWLAIGAGVVLSALALPVWPPLLVSVGALLGWAGYVFWYSWLGRGDNAHLVVGRALPAFSLRTVDGSLISSADWQGQANLLLFFRGNWCPLCMAQIQEVAAQYRELERRGVKVRLISPQAQAHTAQLAARFEAPMQFLLDEGGAAAKQLDIFAQAGTPAGLEALGYDSDTVLPTVIITDAAGVVRYLDLTDNYRVRPEPEVFLQVFDRLGVV